MSGGEDNNIAPIGGNSNTATQLEALSAQMEKSAEQIAQLEAETNF